LFVDTAMEQTPDSAAALEIGDTYPDMLNYELKND
jgi:hypothetical protein